MIDFYFPWEQMHPSCHPLTPYADSRGFLLSS